MAPAPFPDTMLSDEVFSMPTVVQSSYPTATEFAVAGPYLDDTANAIDLRWFLLVGSAFVALVLFMAGCLYVIIQREPKPPTQASATVTQTRAQELVEERHKLEGTPTLPRYRSREEEEEEVHQCDDSRASSQDHSPLPPSYMPPAADYTALSIQIDGASSEFLDVPLLPLPDANNSTDPRTIERSR
ncbi:hypothetical protein BJ742DRAFT_812824 [Cladochytrium replicatum]|nr:hypothetical protein BJ742DRAFT_812824 [Cladochytrium replicatum]